MGARGTGACRTDTVPAVGSYESQYRRSIEDPDRFWAEAARAVDWTRRPDRVLDDSNPPFYRWFTGGELNTCPNALDRHVDGGRGDQAALDLRPPGHRRGDAPSPTASCATRWRGSPAPSPRSASTKGDTVIIYMPMVPEAVVAMLACARLGAVHSVVFGGFAPARAGGAHRRRPAEGDRVGVCGIEVQRVDRVQAAARPGHRGRRPTSPSAASILQRTGRPRAAPRCPPRHDRGRDHDWDEAVAAASTAPAACRSRPPTRSTCSTRRARPASPRASCATTAATPWPCAGACRTSTTPTPARCSGRPATWAGSWATATSSTPRC